MGVLNTGPLAKAAILVTQTLSLGGEGHWPSEGCLIFF